MTGTNGAWWERSIFGNHGCIITAQKCDHISICANPSF